MHKATCKLSEAGADDEHEAAGAVPMISIARYLSMKPWIRIIAFNRTRTSRESESKAKRYHHSTAEGGVHCY